MLAWVRAANQEAQFGPEHANTLRAAQDLIVIWEAAVDAPPVLMLGWGPDGSEGGIHVGVASDARQPIADLVPRTSLERTEAVITDQLRGCDLRAVLLLPGLTAEELARGLGALGARSSALAEAGDVRSVLRDAGVARLLGLPGRPAISSERRLKDRTREAVAVLHEVVLSLDGLMTGSPPDASVSAALRFVAAFVGSPSSALPLLASVDLALQGVPPASRRRWLDALVRALPDHWWSVLHTRCDDVVEAGGGAKVLRGQVDGEGIPLIGYFIAAQVLTGMLTAVAVEQPRTRRTPRRVAASDVPIASPVTDPADTRVDDVYGAEGSPPPHPPLEEEESAPEVVVESPSAMSSGRSPEPTTEAHVAASDPTETALDPRTPRWVAHFETAGPSIMARAQDPSTGREHAGALKIVGHVASSFIDAGDVSAALPLLRLLADQRSRREAMEPQAVAALAAAWAPVEATERLDTLARWLRVGDRAQHTAAREAAVRIGASMGPVLVAMASDAGVEEAERERAFDALDGLGADAGVAVVAGMEAASGGELEHRALLRLAGNLVVTEAMPWVEQALVAPEPQLRADALLALYRLQGEAASTRLITALDDLSPRVVERALGLLALMGSDAPGFLSQLAVAIVQEPSDPVQVQLVVTAAEAAQVLGDTPMPDGRPVADLLADTLRARLKEPSNDVRVPAMVALCDALAVVGVRRHRAALEEALKNSETGLREAAERALVQFERRRP